MFAGMFSNEVENVDCSKKKKSMCPLCNIQERNSFRNSEDGGIGEKKEESGLPIILIKIKKKYYNFLRYILFMF